MTRNGTESGDCYQVAGRLILDSGFGAEIGVDPVLVHATCEGQGPIAGRLFGHAWVEVGPPGRRVALDFANGKHIVLDAGVYRQIGNARDVREYQPSEAIEQMARSRHFGPWSGGEAWQRRSRSRSRD